MSTARVAIGLAREARSIGRELSKVDRPPADWLAVAWSTVCRAIAALVSLRPEDVTEGDWHEAMLALHAYMRMRDTLEAMGAVPDNVVFVDFRQPRARR